MYKYLIIASTTIILGTLGYGYWLVSTYGWLYIDLRDVSPGLEQKYELIKNAKITLFDSDGRTLALGQSENDFGTIYLSHPEVGYCVEEEKNAPFSLESRQDWYDCYEKQSKWVVTWVRNVSHLSIQLGECFINQVPVSVKEYRDDWWLWWVPLPHIGGPTSTYFSINLDIDRINCRVGN